MTRLIYDERDTQLARARVDGQALWLDHAEFEAATGWSWKGTGLCRGEMCIALAGVATRPFRDGDSIDVAGLWRHLGWPVVSSHARDVWVLSEGAAQRAAALTSLVAPDFALPDLSGRLHRLSEQRGRKVLLVTWAAWCGCRAELPRWQALQESVQGHEFTVFAVALDQPDAARPWIEAVAPSYPCVVDRDHRVAELYNLVNVPQAVWIDEAGYIVRPPEPAGMTDAFRAMDRGTLTLPEAARLERDRAKSAYLSAVRDWVLRGTASPHVASRAAVAARIQLPDAAVLEAHARFRLALALLRDGRGDEAAEGFAAASRLHPESWAMWRQVADKMPNGLAATEEFWRRVDALGERPYYPPSDLTQP